jgi:hypothetical protein
MPPTTSRFSPTAWQVWPVVISECKGLELGICTVDSSWSGVDFDPLEGGERKNPPILLVWRR